MREPGITRSGAPGCESWRPGPQRYGIARAGEEKRQPASSKVMLKRICARREIALFLIDLVAVVVEGLKNPGSLPAAQGASAICVPVSCSE
jgi:hypothetical protein